MDPLYSALDTSLSLHARRNASPAMPVLGAPSFPCNCKAARPAAQCATCKWQWQRAGASGERTINQLPAATHYLTQGQSYLEARQSVEQLD